ncbi:MAG: RsmB/NOP family class I SAM-dependent RNA methyltransferase [Erythrobacter sp.]|uniref:RsmB/NOP family class I SAM-dependent RNA methyltransferase n=1 Tax=Erythrobacter sp. TaxID=1042 RepID=UPI00260C0699|nr:RsmB/NOP family class I SAM-dependent RNA methyltransferase [Erythrobacter sp.]MDJ0979068.1 RsmB/NOP family class I SAM-dependent RNA methyltransferase [Erythrobacter sp.]
MAQPTGIHARRAALKLLDAVLRRGETLEQAAPSALRDVRDANDKALSRAIAGEALRWLIDLDHLIDSATQKPLPKDAKPRSVLRLMLAQALRLETPAHAVIATGLPLLAGGPRRLAHGVFSTLMKRNVALPRVPTLPAEVVVRWGTERAAATSTGLTEPPEVDLRLKNAADTALWQARLGGMSLSSGHVRVPRGTPVEKLSGYEEGAWWVQDFAASIPATVLGGGRGHALDLCAAPGGKTMALAANGWNVTAIDISKRRLDALKANLKRTGLTSSTVRADALKWEPKHAFDAILLDAPCTATGTCRRHPDVLHRIRPQEIVQMVKIQRALIARATDWLKPGGTLIYAVCSLEREEGEEQAEWIDATFNLSPMPIRVDDLPAGLKPTPEGWVRTHPGMLGDEGGLDGFFVARFKRRP